MSTKKLGFQNYQESKQNVNPSLATKVHNYHAAYCGAERAGNPSREPDEKLAQKEEMLTQKEKENCTISSQRENTESTIHELVFGRSMGNINSSWLALRLLKNLPRGLRKTEPNKC